jgi:hypothetical protein
MERDLVSLINKIQSKRGEDAFEVSNNPISEVLNQEKDLKIIYDEGDLTKNFVRFATDLLSVKFGDHFMEDIIKGFGETLKTDRNDFKESYRNKSSSIKEILPSVFIHTSMSKILMESLIIDLVTKARLTIKFYSLEKGRDQTWTMELIMKEAEKYDSITAFGRGNPSAYSAAIKLGIREAIIIAMKKRKHAMTYERAIQEKMKTV